MTLRTVLVVTGQAPLRASIAAALDAHGYKALTAATYAEGRKLLIDWQPEALITTVRLGDHNGLHLAIVSRLSSVLTKTIVIGYADPVLEAEAERQGAVYLTTPSVNEVIAAVEAAVQRRERKWPRARTDITAHIADQAVRLVDLSYGGFRIEVASDTTLAEAQAFDLTIGDLRVPALPVWMKQPSSSEHVWCGASVAADGEINPAWREFVDEALGRTVGQ